MVWITSILPLISSSSSLFSRPLSTIPGAPTTIDITVTFRFRGYFSSQTRFKNLPFFFLYFIFCLRPSRTVKSTLTSVFLLTDSNWLIRVLVIWHWLVDPFVSQIPRFIIIIIIIIIISCSYPYYQRFVRLLEMKNIEWLLLTFRIICVYTVHCKFRFLCTCEYEIHEMKISYNMLH